MSSSSQKVAPVEDQACVCCALAACLARPASFFGRWYAGCLPACIDGTDFIVTGLKKVMFCTYCCSGACEPPSPTEDSASSGNAPSRPYFPDSVLAPSSKRSAPLIYQSPEPIEQFWQIEDIDQAGELDILDQSWSDYFIGREAPPPVQTSSTSTPSVTIKTHQKLSNTPKYLMESSIIAGLAKEIQDIVKKFSHSALRKDMYQPLGLELIDMSDFETSVGSRLQAKSVPEADEAFNVSSSTSCHRGEASRHFKEAHSSHSKVSPEILEKHGVDCTTGPPGLSSKLGLRGGMETSSRTLDSNEKRARIDLIIDMLGRGMTNEEIISYFNKSGTSKPPSPALGQLFDKYLDDPDNEKDKLGIEGTMSYLQALEVSLEEPAMLAVSTLVKCPTMGEIVRADFITGWDAHHATTIAQQKFVVQEMRKQMANASDPEFFKSVYKHSFFLARQPGQRAVMLENATEFWRMLFGVEGLRWATRGDNWLEMYIEFLQTEWKKSVSKDLWDQTLNFAKKTLEDTTLSWWSEDSAWPGVIDDFVSWVKKRREEGEKMDTA